MKTGDIGLLASTNGDETYVKVAFLPITIINLDILEIAIGTHWNVTKADGLEWAQPLKYDVSFPRGHPIRHLPPQWASYETSLAPL